MAAQLKFQIDNQIITRLDKFEVVAMSRNYLRAVFWFPAEWGEGDKIAIFHSGSRTYKMILDDKNECWVPWEALKGSGMLYVSAYSGDLITTNMAEVSVAITGYTEKASPTQNPTADIYAVVMERLERIRKMVDLGFVVEDGILCVVHEEEAEE